MKTGHTTSKSNSSNNNKELRRFLENKSTELRSHLGAPARNPVLHASTDPYDSGDWAEKTHEEWIFLAQNNADSAVLRDVEDALERLNRGNYGICMDCGIEISKKRLEAVPWAVFCITCQERRQAGQN